MQEINTCRKIERIFEKLKPEDFNSFYAIYSLIDSGVNIVIIPPHQLSIYQSVYMLKSEDEKPKYGFTAFLEDVHREWVKRYIIKLQKGEFHNV